MAPFSLGIHWTGAAVTRHNDYSIFCKGPMWIIIHMDSINSTYDDYDNGHMNVFLEYYITSLNLQVIIQNHK